MPRCDRSRRPASLSSRRSTARSPWPVGSVETRTSTGLPPTRSVMRPSCGRRFSAMSSCAMILIREISEAWMRLARTHDVAQRAVDAEAHHRGLLERLDVDVGGAFAQRLRQQRVDHADHRRVVGRLEQVFDGRHVLQQLGQVEVGVEFVGHLRGVAAGAGVGAGDRRLQFGALHRAQRDAAEAARHFGDRGRRGGARDPHFDRLCRRRRPVRASTPKSRAKA